MVEGITNPDIIQAWPLIVLIGLCILDKNDEDRSVTFRTVARQHQHADFVFVAPPHDHGRARGTLDGGGDEGLHGCGGE